MTYFRLKLATGAIAGSRPVGLDYDKHHRRDCLLQINSTEKVKRRDGQVMDASVTTYGAVLHYALVHVYERPLAFAYVSCVKSTRDRNGRSGYAAERLGSARFSSAGGTRSYAPAVAMRAVVGTPERGGVHYALVNREPASEHR